MLVWENETMPKRSVFQTVKDEILQNYVETEAREQVNNFKPLRMRFCPRCKRTSSSSKKFQTVKDEILRRIIREKDFFLPYFKPLRMRFC